MLNEEAGPFFIVGSGRSGTTLLRMILCSHSKLSIPPETWFLLDLIERFPLHDALDRRQLDGALHVITSHYRWPDLEIDEIRFTSRARALTPPNLRSLADLVYTTIAARDGRSRWGDKTPPYVQIVPELAELYPEARFIHLIRDGRDVAESFRRQGWGGRWLVQNVREWAGAIEHLRSHRTLLNSKRLLELRYEDLVLSPEASVRKTCSFLDIEYEACMLNWSDTVREKVPARELEIHQKLFRAPQADDVSRWEREHTKLQTFSLEAHIGESLAYLGYPTRYYGSSWRTLFPLVRLGYRVGLPIISLALRAHSATRRRLGAPASVERKRSRP